MPIPDTVNSMNVTEYGTKNEKTLMLLPGVFANAELCFGKVIPELADNYHVIAVDYDGFDGKQGEFTSFIRMAKKIEWLVQSRFDGELYAVYGSSVGGELAGLLVQRKNIIIAHAVLGSPDLENCGEKTAKMRTKMMGTAVIRMLQSGQVPEWIRRSMNHQIGEERTEKYLEILESMPAVLTGVTRISMERQFYSHLTTRLETNIDVPGTRVHILFASKMGDKYLERYEQHFNNPDIIRNDYGLEEMLFFHQEEWLETLNACID